MARRARARSSAVRRREDGPERVRGEARYTADLKLPGMLHAAVLRSPHAHARVKRIDLAPALALPGVRAAIGPGDAHGARRTSAASRARRSLPSRPTRSRQARAAVDAIDVEWEELEVVLDPDEAVEREQLIGEPRALRARRRRDARSPRRTSSSRPTYRTQIVLHNSMETHQAVCEWVGDTLDVYISTQYIWGVRDAVAEHARPARRTRCASSASSWAAASARRTAPDEYTFIAAELAKRTRPARCAARSRAARRTLAAGQPQRDDPAADAPAPAATARSSRSTASSSTPSAGRGWYGADRRPDADALRLRERAHGHATARSSTRRR